jgi:hypothetical protein
MSNTNSTESMFIRSLKRLHKAGSVKVTVEVLNTMLEEKKITQEEYDFIVA